MTAIVRQAPVPSPLSATLTRLFRARRLVQRNLLVYKHTWLVLFSGFFEPLFYLLGIGYGLGTVIKTVELSDGRAIAFAAFVAPGLLAMSSLNGAVAESIFNVFFKLNFAKTYDGILATPLGIR
jgi:lipooligosaccharide transport system permease protein